MITNNNYDNATDAFKQAYQYVNAYGQHYGSTKAVFNSSFTILDPMDRVITTSARKFNQEYSDYEWDWYLKGDRDASEISEKAKIWKQMFVGDTTEVNSNYGYFWNYNNQLDRAIEELKNNPVSRRAVVVHYDINELDRYKYDTPCNDVLNFYMEDDFLSLTVFARSIDLWFGFCNDQYCFSKLMELVANRLNCKVGKMHWFITNLHIYERHFNKF
jgi:thymidylate synthase